MMTATVIWDRNGRHQNQQGYTHSTYPQLEHSAEFAAWEMRDSHVKQCATRVYVFLTILSGLALLSAFMLWRAKRLEVAKWTAVGSASCFALIILGVIIFLCWRKIEKDSVRNEHENLHGPPVFSYLIPHAPPL